MQTDIVFQETQIETHFSHQILFGINFPDGKKNLACAVEGIFTLFLSFCLPASGGGAALFNLFSSWGKNEIVIIIWLIGGALSRSKVSSRFALVRSASGPSDRDQGEKWDDSSPGSSFP